MSQYPSIHDAYGGFGEKPDNEQPSTTTIMPAPTKKKANASKDDVK